MSPLLTLDKISKTYDTGVHALDQVSLEVAHGKITTLLGASGCGKSTLLRIVAGLLPANEGAVQWQTKPNPGDIGFVFQDATLLPWATVAKNITTPLSLLDVSPEEQVLRLKQAIELVRLTGFEDAFPRELSGGMRMRVSLARALASKPKILLMDEPFAALDEITRSKLNRDLLDICETRGITVLFVTHSVFESVFLSDTIIVMTPRPGRPFTTKTLSHPSKRDETYRLAPEYNQLCRDISLTMTEAMREIS